MDTFVIYLDRRLYYNDACAHGRKYVIADEFRKTKKPVGWTTKAYKAKRFATQAQAGYHRANMVHASFMSSNADIGMLTLVSRETNGG